MYECINVNIELSELDKSEKLLISTLVIIIHKNA